MSVAYDEIKITTRREITICEEKISRLQEIIAALEKKYRRNSDDFFSKTGSSSEHPEKEISYWQESLQALARWKERLAAHQEIMKI